MKRRWKAVITLAIALAVLLVVNAVVTDNQTKPAGVTIADGQILRLNGGDVQVLDQGPRRAQPIVLIHCSACSLQWWERLAPLLARDHRVIRIDLLGFGGSEKPTTGYSIPEEASIVAEALGQLEVQGAVVVGHSLGFDVTTALAAEHSELVDRAVDIGEAPDDSFNDLALTARLLNAPVIGQAMWRTAPDFLIRDGYERAFAPGYDLADGFDDPDQVISDLDHMTYTSFHEIQSEASDYEDEEPLDGRIRSALVPLLVIFGTEDQFADDPVAAANAYADVPGAQIHMVQGSGHSPNIEDPELTARLIEHFAGEAEYRPPRHGRGRESAKHPHHQQNKGHG